MKYNPPIESQFENIHIYIHEIEIIKIWNVPDPTNSNTNPGVSVWTGMAVNGMPNSKDLVGNLWIMFGNGTALPGTAIYLEGVFSVVAPYETESADSFCKLVQYLFQYTENHINENDIKDEKGDKLVLPSFPYSKDNFMGRFPQ